MSYRLNLKNLSETLLSYLTNWNGICISDFNLKVIFKQPNGVKKDLPETNK